MLTYKDRTPHYIKEPLVFDFLSVLQAVNLHPQFTLTSANHTRRFYPQKTRRNIRIPAHPHFTIIRLYISLQTNACYSYILHPLLTLSRLTSKFTIPANDVIMSRGDRLGVC